MITFYDGHIVSWKEEDGIVIGIIPSSDGVRNIQAYPGFADLLANTTICVRSFEHQSNDLGGMYVCPIGKQSDWDVEVEKKDVAEKLGAYGFNFRIVDKPYRRLDIDCQKAA